jgi:serine O-acetyltransferase
MADLPLHLQRLAHRLHTAGHARTARVLTYVISFLFAAILPPEPELPPDLRLHHHALGVVLHPKVRIGRRVHLQHHVTLGTDVPNASAHFLDIGNDVHVGAYAVLLGPISVGDGARIGAGSVVTKDVPAGATVVGNPARTIGGEAA